MAECYSIEYTYYCCLMGSNGSYIFGYSTKGFGLMQLLLTFSVKFSSLFTLRQLVILLTFKLDAKCQQQLPKFVSRDYGS